MHSQRAWTPPPRHSAPLTHGDDPRSEWSSCAAPIRAGSSSTPTTTAGKRATSPRTHTPRCACTGRRSKSRSGSRARLSASRQTSRMPTSLAVRGRASSGRGRRNRARYYPTAASSKSACEASKQNSTDSQCHGRRSGEDSASFPTASSSGTEERPASTIESSTCGKAAGWRTERLFP